MTLRERMAADGYDGYAYSYPHKTAYRPLAPPVPLSTAWQDEERERLFLYVHLPFCEMRCGFCNLFTTVRPQADRVETTLRSLERQSAVVRQCLRPARIAQVAFGGGTPTYLHEAQLERLFLTLRGDWAWSSVPCSLEASPATVSAGKLALLRQLGVTRLSLGAQSFLAADLKAMGRPQPEGVLERACQLIRDADFPVFNLDLIYGHEDQTAEGWRLCLERALVWRPQEFYLYPLYIGALTGLDRLGRRPGERRRALYRQAREQLLAAGYEQVSMRLFRLPGVSGASEWSCQDDGMVGLGPGARSYTRSLHYSSEYAVGQAGVRAIVAGFDAVDYATAHYGVRLDQKEQDRRRLIKSLLRAEGVPGRPEGLEELTELGLAEQGESFRLTEEGLAWTDTIGPWLYSEAMRERMREFELR